MTEFEQIYGTLLGELLPEYAVPGIEDAFAPGSFCDKKYAEMRDAYQRLCLRLGVREEDPDLEIMVNSLTDIQHHIAGEMFRLGKKAPLCKGSCQRS